MKILMALMGLEIGGAETHVVELSKALKNMGHEIVVTSNGGVYQKELEESGIKHVRIPLHSKKPSCFLKSFFALKKLFDEESFDIVHAHARIPAYICGLLAKRYTFRFVTTAHWVFKITPLWKRLANWGEKTIAVSDDIKEYLIKNYGVWSDNISTTINGIDTKKFSKDIDFSDIKEEFSLKDDAYRILYVSRMDASRSAVAYMVASAIPEILKVKENAELVIVGDGDDFARLKAHTDKINSSLGREVIKLTGARVDINKFVAASDAFVGVSRSALEAMAAGLPVIIAGNEGYIGIFGEDKFKVSYDTNYCCRGCEEATDEVVLRDLLKIVASTDDEIEKMSLYNKSVIEKYYSAKAMAKDYDDMYKTLLPLKHFKAGEIIINGYYGYGNIGDDALLQAIVENAKRLYPYAKITVLSANPKETAIRYTVRSIHRYNIPRIIKEMKGARLFISGGGSLLQDVTSTKSLVYYTYLLRLAKKHGLITSVYANGFGPITRAKNLEKVKKVLSEVDFITLREPASAEAVRELIGREVKVSADPAFALSGVNDKWKARLLLKSGIEEDKKYFALSLRSWSKNDKDVVEKIQKYVNAVHEKYGYFPLFVAMQPSKDLPILNEIKEGLSFDAKIVSDVTARELISILEKMEFSVGMRLHFLIFSAVAGVLPIALSYDPKINSLMEYIGLDTSVSSSDIDLDELFKITARAIEEKEKFSEILSEKVSEMKKLTEGDTLLIKE